MKERYLADPVEKFTGNYQSSDKMERYYQLRKVKFLNVMIKNIAVNNSEWVLDTGAGEGTFLNMIKKFNKNCMTIGLDLSLLNCRRTKKNGHEAICADGENLPIKYDSIDVIFLLDVIEHLADAEILDNLHKILKKEGIILISTPNKYGIYEYKELVYFGRHIKDIINALQGKPRSYFPYHIHMYSMKEIIRTMERHRFFIENMQSLGFCFPFSGILNLILMKKNRQLYNSKRLIKMLEYLEKQLTPLNFQIIMRARKEENVGEIS